MQMSFLKPNDSSPSIWLATRRYEMLSKHSERGSSGASSFKPTKPADPIEWAAFSWMKGLNDSDSALVRQWNEMDPKARNEAGLEVLRSVEALLDRAQQRLALAALPGTREEVSGLLLQFADMLGCKVPQDEGLNLMTKTLEALPRLLYDVAAERVAATHRFARLPYPSDFLGSVAGELAYLDRQRGIVEALKSAIHGAIVKRTTPHYS